mgnify:CR=1 FL=1
MHPQQKRRCFWRRVWGYSPSMIMQASKISIEINTNIKLWNIKQKSETLGVKNHPPPRSWSGETANVGFFYMLPANWMYWSFLWAIYFILWHRVLEIFERVLLDYIVGLRKKEKKGTMACYLGAAWRITWNWCVLHIFAPGYAILVKNSCTRSGTTGWHVRSKCSTCSAAHLLARSWLMS